ncbi:MAG: hypothetical protein JSS49_13230 [Planctomycetes bacterium]|nr:hypothetical protein [Planctomycetota bacterium]
MVRWVPADANAVILIDVDALFKAPLAIRENWQKQAADRFVNHEINVPPDAHRVVMASQLDLGGGLQPVWEMGVVELDRTPSLALVARREGGKLDSIAGHSAIRLDNGRMAVELEPGILLGTAQPNRQIISRWVGSVKTETTSRLSPFLQQSLKQADRTSQLLFALDLLDSVTVNSAKDLLAKFEPLKGKEADQADIADILASVKGILLTVHVTDKREGSVHVEFSKPTVIMKSVAKPLLEEILKSLEISLEDSDHWVVTVSGSALEVKVEFSQADLRRIVSLLAASSVSHDVHEATASEPSPEAEKAEISRKYFRSVKTLVDELRKSLNKSRDNHAVWMERYARKIDDLPIKDVDKDLLVFGGNVSSSLRYQAQAGRVAALRSGVREAQPVYQSYSYGAGAVGPYGSYGGYSFSGTARVMPNYTQIRTEEHASASQVRIAEMKQIEDGMVQIRRAMTERYNIEF